MNPFLSVFLFIPTWAIEQGPFAIMSVALAWALWKIYKGREEDSQELIENLRQDINKLKEDLDKQREKNNKLENKIIEHKEERIKNLKKDKMDLQDRFKNYTESK
jgi:membrane protein implicated in regulation of membrane protease activity